jgi:hypothetical protein
VAAVVALALIGYHLTCRNRKRGTAEEELEFAPKKNCGNNFIIEYE